MEGSRFRCAKQRTEGKVRQVGCGKVGRETRAALDVKVEVVGLALPSVAKMRGVGCCIRTLNRASGGRVDVMGG
jgi:hypothetical protein